MDVKDALQQYQCKVCSAHATGFHFDAQSCSACAAFFRRSISLTKRYRCQTGTNDCYIIYTEKNLCRFCRFKKCVQSGMKQTAVQPKKNSSQFREYCTRSGLKRNKRFGTASILSMTHQSSSTTSLESLTPGISTTPDPTTTTDDDPLSSISSPNSLFSPLPSSSDLCGTFNKHDRSGRNTLKLLVDEEMRIAERRRMLFCERPVGSLLGASKSCPYTKQDIKPLSFRNFRKSIRAHILLIYEWLRALPEYSELSMDDQIALLRKCVLYHTVLDPCFITIQIGDMGKFVMQNGGYVSTVDGCDDGWSDEREITRDSKKMIYGPLLNRLMTEVVAPMKDMNLSFEESVALKALVSFQGTMCDISSLGRPHLKNIIESICQSLYENISSNFNKAERFGNILLMLSPIFDSALNWVESHHQVQFFDLWQLDSLLLQFLKNKV